MKKFILIFLSVICVAGVVALGWLIFNSKSIASIEIDGQIQTLYIAGQDIDFEGAKLKVTYKNGNVKIDLVRCFSYDKEAAWEEFQNEPVAENVEIDNLTVKSFFIGDVSLEEKIQSMIDEKIRTQEE